MTLLHAQRRGRRCAVNASGHRLGAIHTSRDNPHRTLPRRQALIECRAASQSWTAPAFVERALLDVFAVGVTGVAEVELCPASAAAGAGEAWETGQRVGEGVQV